MKAVAPAFRRHVCGRSGATPRFRAVKKNRPIRLRVDVVHRIRLPRGAVEIARNVVANSSWLCSQRQTPKNRLPALARFTPAATWCVDNLYTKMEEQKRRGHDCQFEELPWQADRHRQRKAHFDNQAFQCVGRVARDHFLQGGRNALRLPRGNSLGLPHGDFPRSQKNWPNATGVGFGRFDGA